MFFEPDAVEESFLPVVGAYKDVATALLDQLPACPERTTALRKLLESKEAALRGYVIREALTAADEAVNEIGAPPPADERPPTIGA
jgi:hypothetical protein